MPESKKVVKSPPQTAKNPVRMVNRGAAGLLSKKGASSTSTTSNVTDKSTDVGPLIGPPLWEVAPKDNFRCDGDIIDIDKLTPDPMNARLHPDRNMESIKDSLALYGQTKALVVRKQDMTVYAGNGTLEAAKQLGWSKVVCSIRDWTEIEARGYGLADNRSAEHARWDFEVVTRIDKMLAENNHPTTGWSNDELEVLRSADWVPPAVDDSTDSGAGTGVKIIVTPEQKEVIDEAVSKLKGDDYGKNLAQICKEWSDGR